MLDGFFFKTIHSMTDVASVSEYLPRNLSIMLSFELAGEPLAYNVPRKYILRVMIA